MARRQFRCGWPIGFLVGVSVLAGCPVPANYTTTTSAPVTGRIAWEDGAPARDLAVVLSTEWARTPCGKVALQTKTDAVGAFELAGTTEHHDVFWVIPNLDIVAPRFDICVSVDDSLRHVYTGIGSLSESAPRDALTCVVWRWEGSPEASCNGHTTQAVVSGGHWSDSTHVRRTGFYRLLLAEQSIRVKGYKKNHPQDRPYVFVQWVQPLNATDTATARFRVDTTVSLPIDRNKVTSISHLQLWRREGQWMASLEGYKKTFMTDFSRAELIFALGMPGEIKQVSGP